MPNQAAAVLATMNGTQTKPAFCSHIGPVCRRPSGGRRRTAERAEEARR
jgi:hypothetical protein